jgi:transcriptional regulator with XRE-family HTH domain
MTNRIAELRAAAGLTQNELAQRICDAGPASTAVTGSTVSRWERGTTVPGPTYRRLIAHALNATIPALGLTTTATARTRPTDYLEAYVTDDAQPDPRVEHSQREWVRVRSHLNANRRHLAAVAADLYPTARVGDTGLIAAPGWMPTGPVDLADIRLEHNPHLPQPAIDGTEPETGHVRPMQTLTRPYPRYTHAIRDLAHPRLFENRVCWRLTSVGWDGGKGTFGFGDTTYFAATDCFEAASHELALVALDDTGRAQPTAPSMRDLPFRRLVGDPFDLARRPLMAAISTLTIRRGDPPTFVLHRRDSASVTIAGGMLQVIPSGIFQPSSIVAGAVVEDFDLWRNVMREYSEELLGNAEHDGDGQPVAYGAEPFASLDSARAEGRVRVWCLGVALDALSLVGEILTVAVWDPDVFDRFAGDFVDRNDEGQVVARRLPFTEQGVVGVLGSGRLAPAGAGCVGLGWRYRGELLG